MKTKVFIDSLEKFWNTGTSVESYDFAIFSNDIIYYGNLHGQRYGINNLKNLRSAYSNSIPDLKVRPLEVERSGNRIACTWSIDGHFMSQINENLHQKNNKDNYDSDFFTLVKNFQAQTRIQCELETILYIKKERVARYEVYTDLESLHNQLNINYFRKKNDEVQDLECLIIQIKKLIGLDLSYKEIVYISFLACGFNAKQIAYLFKLSYRTVETIVNKTLIKLGYSTKYQFIESVWRNEQIFLWKKICEKINFSHK